MLSDSGRRIVTPRSSESLLQLHLEDVDQVVHVLLLFGDRLLQRLEVCPDEFDLGLVVLQRLRPRLDTGDTGKAGKDERA